MYFMALLSTIKFFTLLGGPETVRKYLGESSDEQQQGRIIGSFLLIAGIAGVAATSLIFLFEITGYYNRIYPSRYGTYLIILILMIIGIQGYSVVRNSLMGLGYETESEWLPIIRSGLQNTIALVSGIAAFGAMGALLGAVFAVVVAAILGFYILLRHIPWNNISYDSPDDLTKHEMLSAFFSTGLVMFGMTAIKSADIILVGILSTSESVAYYRSALSAATFIVIIPSVISSFFIHNTAADWNEGSIEKLRNKLHRGLRLGIVVSALPGIGLWIMADQFVPLYYSSPYTPAITPLRILLPGVLIFGAGRILSGVGLAQSRRRLLIISTWVAALANIIGNILLVPRLGIVGAAIASSISYALMTVGLVATIWRLGVISSPGTDMIRVLLTLLGGFVFISIVDETVVYLPFNDVISFIITPISGFIGYFMIALVTGALRQSEATKLYSIMKRRIDNTIS
jgi:O-antigen/teichoic acid export membrane protein